MALVWISPIVAFIAMLASRRVPALWASLVALVLAVLVVTTAGPRDVALDDVAMAIAAGAWIALPAVVVILAGLFFTEALAAERPAARPAPGAVARQLSTTCLLAGPFIETATGFGVGFVVALRGVVALGVRPAHAIALAAFSQCLVPWGALGVGTRISAAIVAMPLEELGWRIALIAGPFLLITAPLYWRVAAAAGVAVPARQRIEDTALLALLAVLLYTANTVLPIELAGLAAIGPVLVIRLWLQLGRRLVARDAIVVAAPYVMLVAMLAVTRLVPSVSAWLAAPSLTPGHGAPPFAPLLSPALPLMATAILFVLLGARPGRLATAARATAQKGWRASVLTILLVALAWIMVRSGIADAITAELKVAGGDLARVVVPLLGALGGYLTGSNTGAGSLSMPIASAFAGSGHSLVWLSASAIFVGSVLTALSPVRLAMGQALSGASDGDVVTAVRLLVPYALAAIAVGIAVVLWV